MSDPYKGNSKDPLGHGRAGRVITPSTSDLSPIAANGVVMLAAGNITVVPVDNADSDALAFVGVPAGFVVPFQVRRVTAATAACATIDP